MISDCRWCKGMGQYTSRSIQKRILLIDDEPAACGEFRTILGCPGQTDRGGAGGADDDDYVAKPFSPEDLFGAVQRHIPGLLESSEQESSVEQSAASDELPDQPCSPADCLSAIYEALECRDCRKLENHARTLKKLAVKAKSKTIADHAMRIQLAARGGDFDRVAAAVQRLDHALHSADDGTQNENIAPSLPLSEGASS